jgi:hypothetical protein
MNPVGYLFVLIAGVLLWTLPRRWAVLPLLMGAAYMTRGQVLDVGSVHFPVMRILVTIGLLRTMARGEKVSGGLNLLDRMLFCWGAWLVGTSVGHTAPGFVFRVGVVWTELGSYFLFRIFFRSLDDVFHCFKIMCVLLIPVTAAMIVEKLTGRNSFAMLGGVTETAAFRHGKFRAMGPFAHAILAGTVGAGCWPMALSLWREHRKLAITGMLAAGGIVFASGASGPIMMSMVIVMALVMWKIRQYLTTIRWVVVFMIIALNAVMNDPVYYLLARIDITGGSTGWHRAELIHAAVTHLNEWWLTGTDYTRHWMPTGIHANAIHTDITNHYLQMGVWGGLPLMFLFIGVLWVAFKHVSRALKFSANAPLGQRLLIWTLGAILFGHAANFFSISYFDQSVVFLYLVLAAIGCLSAFKTTVANVSQAGAVPSSPEYEPDFNHHR